MQLLISLSKNILIPLMHFRTISYPALITVIKQPGPRSILTLQRIPLSDSSLFTTLLMGIVNFGLKSSLLLFMFFQTTYFIKMLLVYFSRFPPSICCFLCLYRLKCLRIQMHKSSRWSKYSDSNATESSGQIFEVCKELDDMEQNGTMMESLKKRTAQILQMTLRF